MYIVHARTEEREGWGDLDFWDIIGPDGEFEAVATCTNEGMADHVANALNAIAKIQERRDKICHERCGDMLYKVPHCDDCEMLTEIIGDDHEGA